MSGRVTGERVTGGRVTGERPWQRIQAAVRAHVPHPYMSLLILVPGTICVAESIYLCVSVDDSRASLALLVCRIICVAAFVLTPEWGSYAMCGMAALDLMSNIRAPFTTVILAFLALSIISYLHMRRGILCGAVVSICAFIASGTAPRSLVGNGGSYSFSAFVVAFICIGGIIRVTAGASVERQKSLSLESNQKIAGRLHDYTTNDLTDIIMVVEHMRRNVPDEETRRQLDTIDDAAVDALRHTRQAIRTLRTDGPSTDVSSAEGSSRAGSVVSVRTLRRTVDRCRRTLADIGMDGDVLVFGRPDASMTSEATSLMQGLIRELFGNIGRHGDHAQPYMVMISYTGECAVVETTNAIRDAGGEEPDDASVGLRSGLAHYRLLVERNGGIWRESRARHRWTLRVEIPNTLPDAVPDTMRDTMRNRRG